MIDEIDNIDYIEYDLKSSSIIAHLKDSSELSFKADIQKYVELDKLLRSRGN